MIAPQYTCTRGDRPHRHRTTEEGSTNEEGNAGNWRRQSSVLRGGVHRIQLERRRWATKDVAVTSIVLDYAADIAPGLNIQSDGLGSYLNSRT